MQASAFFLFNYVFNIVIKNTPPKCVVWSALQHWCGEKSLQHFCGLLQLLVWFRFNS